MIDRIKLAEAMGWTLKRQVRRGFGGQPIERKVWHNPEGVTYQGIKLPDPEDDANDDYAVLEWMRDAKWSMCNDRSFYYLGKLQSEYKIGNYARAALKKLS